ncbi:MAG: TonB-dependent receptor [Nevskia sp.]|nr:TonB-dependent receptor [Nevskia sp.]
MKILAVVALAAAPLLAFAADPSSPEVQLGPVEVTATRTDVPLQRELPETLVVDRAQIERSQATDVADVLRDYAGLEVARTGGPGQPASLFVRGGNSNYTVVLIDGIRANNSSDGSAALNNIVPEMIERIEVVEGPRSTLYGPDAIGGVVNIVTRQPGPAQLDANVGGGSFGTVQGGAGLRGAGRLGDDAWGLSFGAQQQRATGIPAFAGAADDVAFRNRTLNGSAQLQVGGVRLEARAWDAEGNTQLQNAVFDPNTFAFTGRFTTTGEDFRHRIFAVQASTHLLPNWLSSLTLSQSEDRLAQNQSSDFVRTVRPEADWHNVVDLTQGNRLSFGLRASRDRVDALSFGSAFGEAKDSDYVYLQDEADAGRHHAVGAVSYLNDGGFGKRFNWNAEYGFDLFDATRLIVNAGSAFHAPTADDRFYPFAGNPNLRPEKALVYEAGVRQWLGAGHSLDLRLFRSDVRDLIEYVPPNFTAVNIGHTRSQGLQGGWNYSGGGWTARLGLVWQDPEDRDAHAPLLRRARLSASGAVQRRIGRFDLGAQFYTSGRRHDIGAIDFLPTTDGGYTTFGLSAGVRLLPGLRLDTRLENALNHRYQTAAGYNQPGSAVYATLRYSLPLAQGR